MMPLSINPTHYYKADAAGLLVDSSGNGYTLTNNGSVTTTTGKQNEAWDLNGTTQYLSRAHGTENDFSTKFSVSMWVNRSAYTGTFPGIIGKGTYNTSIEWLVYIDTGSSNVLRILFDASNYGDVAAPFGSTATWYHLAIVYDGTLAAANRLKVWVDGSAQSVGVTGTIPASLTNPGSPTGLTIGHVLGLDYWTGQIDVVAIVNDAWNSSDVALLYGGGTPPPYSSLTFSGIPGIFIQPIAWQSDPFNPDSWRRD